MDFPCIAFQRNATKKSTLKSLQSRKTKFHRFQGRDVLDRLHPEWYQCLSGPISRDIAIVSLRYPLSRDWILSQPSQQSPKRVRYPPLGAFFYTDISVRYPILQHIARYLCNAPGKQARKHFAILSLKVSRDMKSIATGPLRSVLSLSLSTAMQPMLASVSWIKLWTWSSTVECGRGIASQDVPLLGIMFLKILISLMSWVLFCPPCFPFSSFVT